MSLAPHTTWAPPATLTPGAAARLAAYACLLACLALPARVDASGNVQRVVANADTKAGTAGYTLEIDTRWSDLGGYRPVRVSIAPHAAASVDTVFHVQFRATSQAFYGERGGTIVVDQKIVVPPWPEGSKPPPTTATLSVPHYDPWMTFSLSVWENGEFRPKLSIENVMLGTGGFVRFRGGNVPEALALVIDSQATLPPSFPTNVRTGQQIESLTVTPRELPEQWINLSSVDIVCLTFSELEVLVTSYEAKWRALRSWVAAGGNLWVTGVAKAEHEKFAVGQPAVRVHFNRLIDLEGLLGLAAHERKSGAWTSEGPARWREFHLGQVVALPEQFGFDPRWQRQVVRDGLEQTANQLASPYRLNWELRNGVHLQSANGDFWEFLIPGVGLVPVMPFQVLITLFVVVIGPLNYVYLRRRAKLHLLIVTVPACALVVTLGLFGYALATDGLAVRVRARSYTEIDQRRFEAVCWSRLCYYAGLAPSQGLHFSGDTVVLPIDPRIDDPSGGITRQLNWTGGGSGDAETPLQQHLKSGWLRSRNLTQYLTQRVRQTQAHVKVTSQSDGRLSIDNHLGSTIRHLVLCDAEGKKYGAEEVAGGTSLSLEADAAGGFDTVRQQILRAFQQAEPKRPKGLNERDLVRGRYRYYGPPVKMPARSMRGGVVAEDDRLESALDDVQRQLAQAKLEPRTYVAIVERSPEVELGIPGAREEASFHVILGRW
jgi:hypothetical protein